MAAYDDGRMTEAARVWFILQHFGVRAAVLDGGLLALFDRPDAHMDRTPVVPTPAPLDPVPTSHRPVGLVTRQDLRGRLDDGKRIFDARTAAEFAGEDLRRNARGVRQRNEGRSERLRTSARYRLYDAAPRSASPRLAELRLTTAPSRRRRRFHPHRKFRPGHDTTDLPRRP